MVNCPHIRRLDCQTTTYMEELLNRSHKVCPPCFIHWCFELNSWHEPASLCADERKESSKTSQKSTLEDKVFCTIKEYRQLLQRKISSPDLGLPIYHLAVYGLCMMVHGTDDKRLFVTNSIGLALIGDEFPLLF